jgi:heme oxygenase
MQSVLIRLERETRPRHAAADNQVLALMTSPASVDGYRRFLSRVYGFESPVESALALTPGLDELFDTRGTSSRLLRSDLVALGLTDPAQLARCTNMFPFRSVADALGWVYVLERNAMLHGLLRRHLAQRMPDVIGRAGAYLANNERAIGSRMRELGHILDTVGARQEAADRIVVAGHAAFRCQQHWFAEVVPPGRRIAC